MNKCFGDGLWNATLLSRILELLVELRNDCFDAVDSTRLGACHDVDRVWFGDADIAQLLDDNCSSFPTRGVPASKAK